MSLHLDEYGYTDGSEVLGFRFDLDGDGMQEYFVRSSESTCGTGGCAYDIYEGRSKRRIAELGGNPLFVLRQRINGWPVLSQYGHSSADAGTYSTFVFDGTAFQPVSSVFISGHDLEQLFASLALQQVKAIRP